MFYTKQTKNNVNKPSDRGNHECSGKFRSTSRDHNDYHNHHHNHNHVYNHQWCCFIQWLSGELIYHILLSSFDYELFWCDTCQAQ